MDRWHRDAARRTAPIGSNPPLLESMEIVVALILMALCWFAWYVARERYHLTNRQIAEVACYLALGGSSQFSASAILIATARSRREKQWPHPPMVVSRKRDEQFTQRAWKQDAVVLGYDIHGKPWYWPDRVRVMQGIVLGMTGVRQDHASEEHHYAGHGARRRHPEGSTPVADGHL